MMYNKETGPGKKRTEELSYPNPNLLLINFLVGEKTSTITSLLGLANSARI